MWPRRTTVQATKGIERQPLLTNAATQVVPGVNTTFERSPLLAAGDGPALAGVGRRIGVKADGMGYVVVNQPERDSKPVTVTAPSALQQWGAVAMALLEAATGSVQKPTTTPAADNNV